jgi:hypothetical protein
MTMLPIDGKPLAADTRCPYRMHTPAKPRKVTAEPKAKAAQAERLEALKRKGRIVRVGSNGVTIFKGDRW